MKKIKVYHTLYLGVFIFGIISWLTMLDIFANTNDIEKYSSFIIAILCYMWARLEQFISNFEENEELE